MKQAVLERSKSVVQRYITNSNSTPCPNKPDFAMGSHIYRYTGMGSVFMCTAGYVINKQQIRICWYEYVAEPLGTFSQLCWYVLINLDLSACYSI